MRYLPENNVELYGREAEGILGDWLFMSDLEDDTLFTLFVEVADELKNRRLASKAGKVFKEFKSQLKSEDD